MCGSSTLDYPEQGFDEVLHTRSTALVQRCLSLFGNVDGICGISKLDTISLLSRFHSTCELKIDSLTIFSMLASF